MNGSVRATLEERSRVYSSSGKARARDVVVNMAKGEGVETILDLWGSGESARAFRAACPAAITTSAEIDPAVWSALRLDAQQHGYAAHFGDARKIEGQFDLVWLDLCSQASKATRDLIGAMVGKVSSDGYLALTIMPAREIDELISSDRLQQLALWVEHASRMEAVLFLPYRRENGLPMWLYILTRTSKGSYFAMHLDWVEDHLNDLGWWAMWGFDGYADRRYDFAQRRIIERKMRARDRRIQKKLESRAA